MCPIDWIVRRKRLPQPLMLLIQASLVAVVIFILGACDRLQPAPATYPTVTREQKLPRDIQKRVPATDHHPPVLHTAEFHAPQPLPAPVNTAGAEDSPFILPDGKTLYFFFTPDVRVPPEKQVLDGVSGVWVTEHSGGTWQTPRRVWLQQPGKLALDGAVCIQGSEMWFASAREGYIGVNLFTAHWVNGAWGNWQYAGDHLMKTLQVGEVHLHGAELYFHSPRLGGKGDQDIWMITRQGTGWSQPVNIEAVNSPAAELQPFVSSDGAQLWFTRMHQGTPAVFRSLKVRGAWQKPELIVSRFAGEPTLDDAGNLYFVHHFFENNVMVEADLYVAYKKMKSGLNATGEMLSISPVARLLMLLTI